MAEQLCSLALELVIVSGNEREKSSSDPSWPHFSPFALSFGFHRNSCGYRRLQSPHEMAYLCSFPIKISKQPKCGLMGNCRCSALVSLTCLLAHVCCAFQEENQPPEGDKEEPLGAPAAEEAKTQKSSSSAENFQERRALAIAAKAQEIEKVTLHLVSSIFKYLRPIYKRIFSHQEACCVYSPH